MTEIRTRRRRLQADVDEIVSGNVLMNSVRERPAWWIAGGLVAGILVGRFGRKPLLRAGRDRLLGPIQARAKTALTGLLFSGFANRVAAHFDGRSAGAESGSEAPGPPQS